MIIRNLEMWFDYPFAYILKNGKRDKRIEFTKTEAKLLSYLVRNRNIILSVPQILSNVWEPFCSRHIVSCYISYLSKKLGADFITRRHGFGYGVFDYDKN